MSDLDEYVEGIQAGRLDSFNAWVAGAEPGLRRRLRTFATQVDVEVAIQETLLRIWQGARHHKPDGKSNSLLRQANVIATNLCRDELRKWRREITVNPADLVDQIDPAPEADPMLGRVLMQCLQALPDQQREVMTIRLKSGGVRDAKLAKGAGMTVNTFRQNVARARRRLTNCLAEHSVTLGEHWR